MYNAKVAFRAVCPQLTYNKSLFLALLDWINYKLEYWTHEGLLWKVAAEPSTFRSSWKLIWPATSRQSGNNSDILVIMFLSTYANRNLSLASTSKCKQLGSSRQKADPDRLNYVACGLGWIYAAESSRFEPYNSEGVWIVFKCGSFCCKNNDW